MAFDLGDVVPLSFQIKDAAGALANGGAVNLTITQPDGTAAGPFTLTPTSTGVYNYDFVPVQVGRHVARCVSTGANASSFSDAFDVAAADMGGIISLADAKQHLRVTQSSNDEELRLFLSAATALIEHEVGPVVASTHTEIHDLDETIVLSRAPVMSLTSVVPTFPAAGLFAATPTYLLDGPSGVLRRQPLFFSDWGFDQGFTTGWVPYGLRLTVTYVAGRPIVPAPLQVAARIIVGHLWETRRGAGPKPASGDEDQAYGREMIPDEAVLLMAPYRRAPLVA